MSCEAVEKRHQETPAGRSLDDVAVALPVDDDMLRRDRSKIQRLYSSKSVQVDLLQDNLRVTPLCEWQEHNCKQNARMTVNDDDRKVAGQRESSLEQIASNKSSSGSQQVQTETSNQMATMTESGRFSDQTAGMTEFGQGGPNSEIRTTLPNDIQEMEANTRNQIVTTTETTYSLKGADLSQGQLDGLGKESEEVHDTRMSGSPLHERRKIQAEKSTQAAVMTDIGNDAVQDSDPATYSNYARTSVLTHLKTEMWRKLKFSTRVLKGHTGL